jgi:hypothetical protein
MLDAFEAFASERAAAEYRTDLLAAVKTARQRLAELN